LRLAIGCTVKNRAWALPTWYEHIEAACAPLGITPEYVFCYGTSLDQTRDLLRGEVVELDEDPELGIRRSWNLERYVQMVRARNALLARVRDLSPDLWWSVDSDIYVAPEALRDALETIEHFDAVGGACFMTPVNTAPSYAFIEGDLLVRPIRHDVFQVDAVMAMVLMKPRAYRVDYQLDSRGEDIGHSLACKYRGLRLGWDGRHYSHHEMNSGLNAQSLLRYSHT
jgi:hypothetical protein